MFPLTDDLEVLLHVSIKLLADRPEDITPEKIAVLRKFFLAAAEGVSWHMAPETPGLANRVVESSEWSHPVLVDTGSRNPEHRFLVAKYNTRQLVWALAWDDEQRYFSVNRWRPLFSPINTIDQLLYGTPTPNKVTVTPYRKLKDKYVGSEGTPEREQFEKELKQELEEDIKSGRATPLTEEDIAGKPAE